MRQILVKKTKHTKDLSFNTITLNSADNAYFEPGMVGVIDLELDLDTINILEKQDITFIWALNPKMAELGGMLLGTKVLEGRVRVYVGTVKAFEIRENYPILTGKAVETISLRQVDMIGDVMKLDRGGVEL